MHVKQEWSGKKRPAGLSVRRPQCGDESQRREVLGRKHVPFVPG